MNAISKAFPPLYSCSVCEGAVSVTPMGVGNEPIIVWPCGHTGHKVHANRKVTLYGKGGITRLGKIKLTVRQFLSRLFRRSV